MTDAAIKAAGWLSAKIKKQILDARKGSRAKIKSHEGAGKLPGATPKKPKGKTRVDWSKQKGTDHKDPEDFGGPLRRSKPTTKPQKLRKTRLRSFLEDVDLKTLSAKDKAAAAMGIPAIGGGTAVAVKAKTNKKAGGGKVGMSHQGLYPAEEARSGTMSEKKRAKNMKKDKKQTRAAAPRREALPGKGSRAKITRGPDRESIEHLMQLLTPEMKQKLGLKKGGQVKKKKKQQGYTDRKDESIAMRVKKKRTKKQLKASANESYGKWGSAAKKRGKINRSSSKGWDGNREVSRHYDS